MSKTGRYYFDSESNKVVHESEYFGDRGNKNVTGLVVKTRYAPDGSVLEKPMSQSYINHIQSRNSESIKKMKPNMGAYGA